MKHARKDYQERIQDSENLIPKDEPVFVVRGQDPAGPATLRYWAVLCEATGGSKEAAKLARQHADAMEEWQATVRQHRTDLPEGS